MILTLVSDQMKMILYEQFLVSCCCVLCIADANEPKLAVPVDLIPIDSKQLDESWASKTFKYAHCFSNDITTKIVNDADDLQKWINIATNLQLELRAIGLQKAHAKAVEVFKDYGVYLPDTNEHPVNFDDIITIISNPDWYKSRQLSKQGLIHMVSYGIFRKGYNIWAMNAAKEWLHQKNLHIMNANAQNDSQRRRGKGFVYCNLVLRASNSIADRIQKCMLSCYGEYIGVRQKNKNHTFKKINLNHFEAYIVRPHDMIAEMMTPKLKSIRDIRNAIALGMSNEVTKADVTNIINNMNWSKCIILNEIILLFTNMCLNCLIIYNRYR